MKSKQELIADNTPQGIVVDIGYAQEPNNFLPKEGRRVFGVDLCEGLAPGYEATYKVDLNVEKLPFERVDAVTMGCVLAHLAAPLKALAEINCVLPAGGGAGALKSKSKLLLGDGTQCVLPLV